MNQETNENMTQPMKSAQKPETLQSNQKTDRTNDNTIFIGSKPLVNYIRGINTQFTKWNTPEVIIKSRGKFISKAVDVAEVARRSLKDKGIKITDIKIASESFETDGKKTNISTMDIILGR